jgi:protein-S-isoprenylcysteine O-methyltransferase Ste14
MSRFAILAYGVFCYVMFLGIFVYAIGFIGNFIVPVSLDSAPRGTLINAVIVNLLILAVFAIQHSGMARPTFKQWWTKYIPEPIERSTYVLCSNLAMILFYWQWQPMEGVVWDIQNGVGRVALTFVFACGWATILATTFLINHFDLFGLRQVWLHFRGQSYTQLEFGAPGLYRYVRHPLYVGWLMVFWGAPTMSSAHLLFALATTGYILFAIQLEERNLVDFLPGYANYRSRVPMLVPKFPSK